MAKSTDRDWEKWGKTDPYLGVLNAPRFRKDQFQANQDEFWESGEKVVEGILVNFERVFGQLKKGSALDFGCGVGRLTLALGRRFGTVAGLDISPSMLEECRKNSNLKNAANVAFYLSDDELSHAPGQFDFVLSWIVLQHIPVRRGLPIITQLLERVRPGGGCYIHMSISREVSAPVRAAYWVRDNFPGANPLLNLMKGQPVSRPGMQMNSYPIAQVFRRFKSAQMDRILVTLSDHGGVLTAAFSAVKPLFENSGELNL